jgi:hypothetical protein
VSADLTENFSVSRYRDSIGDATHSSPDVALALSEMLQVRHDGNLLLLSVGLSVNSGAVFKIHFQRSVRPMLQEAMGNFCAILFTGTVLLGSFLNRCSRIAWKPSKVLGGASCCCSTASVWSGLAGC